tara:strand:+ start:121 stop:594 length:474 start_codon:yes stop_codon:yes gene_type:complete
MSDENHQRVTGICLANFRAYGDPKGQPRPRAFSMNGKVRMYDPGTAEHWKGQVAEAAHDHLPAAPYQGPLMLALVFYFKRPKAHFRSNGLLKDNAPLWVEKKPDLDNMAKAVMDALTAMGMWGDDKQVVVVNMLKRYTVDDERAGVEVNVASVGEVA